MEPLRSLRIPEIPEPLQVQPLKQPIPLKSAGNRSVPGTFADFTVSCAAMHVLMASAPRNEGPRRRWCGPACRGVSPPLDPASPERVGAARIEGTARRDRIQTRHGAVDLRQLLL